MRAEQCTEPLATHGEGIVWDNDRERLLWVDMLAGDILEKDGDAVKRYHLGTVAAVVRPRVVGGYVVATRDRFVLTDAAFGTVRRYEKLLEMPDARFNEGACDPQGRFYCGSMSTDGQRDAGTMYRLDPDGSITVVMTHLTISNGLVWAPGGDIAYFADTATQRIDALDFDPESGRFTARREFARLRNEGEGRGPDGLTIDVDGNLWVAHWMGGSVQCISPAGVVIDVVELPAKRVTSCCFGGTSLDTLYITTSRYEMDEPEPCAGAVFCCRPATRGVPIARFGG